MQHTEFYSHLDEGQTTNLPSGSNNRSRRDMSYKPLPLAADVQSGHDYTFTYTRRQYNDQELQSIQTLRTYYLTIQHAETLGCRTCNRSIAGYEEFRRHICHSTKDNNSTVCSICYKILTKEYLPIHIAICENELVSKICLSCGKMFNNPGNLQRHSKVRCILFIYNLFYCINT